VRHLELTEGDQRERQLVRDQHVLVPGAVRRPVAEQHGVRLREAERPAQRGEGVLERPRKPSEVVREGSRDARTRGEQVGDARWRAHVVLEHAQDPVGVPDDVEAGHADAHRRRGQGRQRRLEVVAGLDHVGRHHAGAHDRLVAVDVGHERLQRPRPLCHASLQVGPFTGLDQAWHRVDVEGLCAVLATERHAGGVRRRAYPLGQRGQAKLGHPPQQLAIRPARVATGHQRLVVEARRRRVRNRRCHGAHGGRIAAARVRGIGRLSKDRGSNIDT
jgi:hypothetical protein